MLWFYFTCTSCFSKIIKKKKKKESERKGIRNRDINVYLQDPFLFIKNDNFAVREAGACSDKKDVFTTKAAEQFSLKF